MIKINTILNNVAWKKYLGNPNQFIQRKVKNVNSGFKDYRKNIIFCTLLLSGNKEIKKLNKNNLIIKELQNYDSLKFMKFLTTIEEKYKINISPKNFEIFFKTDDIHKYLEKIKNKKK